MDENDLPALLTLHVLLEERQVTRAARRLGITQSSMSHRLARLRERLDDPLFVRSGASLLPTPRALEMAGPLEEGLSRLAAAMHRPSGFEPHAAEFDVQLFAPDLLTSAVLHLTRRLARDAPAVRLDVRNIGAGLGAALRGPVRSLAIVPTHFLDDTAKRRVMGSATFEVVGRSDHPIFSKRMTRKRWLSYPHVVVSTGNERESLIESALDAQGLERHVGLRVPSFLAALVALAGSDFLMNAPLPIGLDAIEALGLRTAAPPIALPRVQISLGWHERFVHDPAHRWLRKLAFETLSPYVSRKKRSR